MDLPTLKRGSSGAHKNLTSFETRKNKEEVDTPLSIREGGIETDFSLSFDEKPFPFLAHFLIAPALIKKNNKKVTEHTN